jgi:hypothetical protein
MGASVIAFAPDLLDRSRIMAVAPGVEFVRAPGDVAGRADAGSIVVMDLSRDGVADALEAVVATGARVIGFGSHVDRQRLDAAQAVGCEALARSAFFARIGSIVSMRRDGGTA